MDYDSAIDVWIRIWEGSAGEVLAGLIPLQPFEINLAGRCKTKLVNFGLLRICFRESILIFHATQV